MKQLLLLALSASLSCTSWGQFRNAFVPVQNLTAQNWSVMDWSACPNGAVPTATNIQNSMFPFPSGASVTISNPASVLNCITLAQGNPWMVKPNIAGLSWPNNGVSGMELTSGGATEDNDILITFPASGTTNQRAYCVWIAPDIPQNQASWGATDIASLNGNAGGGDFVNMQMRGTGTYLQWNLESGVGTNYASNNAFTTAPPATIVCGQVNYSGTDYLGLWNAATGQIIPGSLAQNPANGSTSGYIYLGAGAGTVSIPAGTDIRFGSVIMCGLVSTAANCNFPLGTGLELYPAVDSPGNGAYTGTTAVTISDTPSAGNIYYTLDGSTPACANGAATHGTLYTGSFNISSYPTTLNEIACLPGYANSALNTSVYSAPTPPGAVVQSIGSNNYGSSVSAALLSNTTSGNNLTAAIQAGSSACAIAAPTGCGVTWTQDGTGGSAGGTVMAVYTAPIVAGAACTVSVSVSGCSTDIHVGIWETNGTGAADGAPVYHQNTQYCTTGCTGATFSSANAGDLVLDDVFTGYSTALSAVTTFSIDTQAETGDGSYALLHYGWTGSGSTNATFTQTSGNTFTEVLVGLKP
jgi:hypothetical protein